MFGRCARIIWVLGVVGLAAGGTESPARAASWARAVFRESGHDFGPVPRGAVVRHPFVAVNPLAEPLTIVDVRASCGCTTGRADPRPIPPGGSAVVEAVMDTRNFVGRKETTLFVTVVTAGGKEAEVRLGVGSTILSDVVLNPGTADFGVVARGQTPALAIQIDRVGMPQWRVQRMVSQCRAIDATLQETRRDGDAVSYVLNVRLRADAPPGIIRDEIRLLSNDPTAPALPVAVAGVIRGELTASPGTLALGRVQSAGTITGKILVRGPRPFAIRGVEGDGDGFQVEVDSPDARPLHVLTVTFDPQRATGRGDLRRVFRIHSDDPGEPPVEVLATLQVEP